ncbi:hypothetical protein RDWZM_001830 [Blomia tropicalis]|uniref:Uncharacterized protein n=1 Tax=Blomia tropicalis TaxID=40697 RepID=A0A9Q0RR42_BLOTA|nr:hypothetical protein RDWZM_001830 [Blomia tropicalis]
MVTTKIPSTLGSTQTPSQIVPSVTSSQLGQPHSPTRSVKSTTSITNKNLNIVEQQQQQHLQSKSSSTAPSVQTTRSEEVRSIQSNQSVGLDNNTYDKSVLGDQRMFDVVQVALLCRQHRMMLFALMNPGLYFPFNALRPGYQWEKYEELPIGFRNKIDKFWALEPIILFEKIMTQPNFKEQIIQEIDLEDVVKYLSEPVKATDHPVSQLLIKMCYTLNDIYRCFLDYLNHCYPSMFMGRYQLQDWINDSRLFHFIYLNDRLLLSLQIDPEKDHTLGYIDFEEFLFGLLFQDIECPNQSPFAEIRLSYIYRYYTKGSSAGLQFEDLILMIKDVESIHFRNTQIGGKVGTIATKKEHQIEAEMFWKESGLPLNVKGTGMTFSKFRSIIDKVSKVSKYFNPDLMLRTVKSVLSYEQNRNFLQRSLSIGRDHSDIFRKRETYICSKCAYKPFGRHADHTVKTFYNGSIIDLIDNEKWISVGPRRADRAQRRMSHQFFKDDTFANVVIDSLTLFVEESIVRTPHQQPPSPVPISGHVPPTPPQPPPTLFRDNRPNRKRLPNQPIHQLPPPVDESDRWGIKFFTKYQSKIVQLLNDLETKPIVNHLPSPVAIFTDYGGRLNDLFAFERNISQLAPFCFPVRFIFMINWNDFARFGIELIMYYAANKTLLPDKYYLLLGKCDAKKWDMIKGWITKQCEILCPKDGVVPLVTAIIKLLERTPFAGIIDGVVTVLPGVDYVGNIMENLDKLHLELVDHIPRKGKDNKEKLASTISSKSMIVDTGKPLVHSIFTSNEQLPKKVIHLRTPDEIMVQLGKLSTIHGNNIPNVIVLVDNEKIRPLYIVDDI